jgi:general secretion pathway protein H
MKRAQRPDHGFTLVEILVVVVILAVAAGIALVALERDERTIARREAQRFGGALEYAASRAQLRTETLGVNAAGRQIRFWRRTDSADTWALVTDDDMLALRTLDDPLDASALTYAGRALQPNVIVPLRPSGRNEPATFAIAGGGVRVLIALDPLNRVSIGVVETIAP